MSGTEKECSSKESAAERYYNISVALGCVALWITLSSSVILYNKWVLAYFGFPYPLFLTLFHMGFCSTLAFILVRVLKVVEPINMSAHTYMTSVVPIGVLFSATLCMSNAAYLFLSVSFIQMLKATIPVATFLIGCVARLETFKWISLFNVMVISVGVMIASYGTV
jgi:drug/metabolite transporter (DMT)-like permease